MNALEGEPQVRDGDRGHRRDGPAGDSVAAPGSDTITLPPARRVRAPGDPDGCGARTF
ncbi:hypothetical protein [Streptomyces sp. NPDC059371]|uniref:hypothetical protein n=1 Tax=Streptomyces sp. NPDC059371 TaxID=3346812 RepID=UPI00368C2C16